MLLKRLAVVALALGMFLSVGSVGVTGFLTARAEALSSSSFDPSMIITDAIFYDKTGLSASQIQNFLNAKVPNCDTNGTKPSGHSGYATRADWGRYKGYPPPYTCIKNYKLDTPARDAESGICGNLTAKTNRTAAQIIKDVSNACGINPKVLIVLLQKEQGLVTDDWPWSVQYKKATGYGCPDTAPCNSEYFGFFNQVYKAAWQFRKYRANPTNYNYVAGQNNKIYYNPDSSCGYSWVKIKNQATAGLYNYTPYQPNKATLSVGLGQTATCGAYGNKNFWWYFNQWFGSTKINLQYASLDTPRWMETKADIQKRDPYTGVAIDSVIPSGKQIYFPKKVKYNGQVYLRTEHDQTFGIDKGILLTDLAEIDLNYVESTTPRWMVTKQDVYKINPITEARNGRVIPAGTTIFFPTKYSIAGKTYVRTQHDTDHDLDDAVLLSALQDTSISYSVFTTPRWLKAIKDTYMFDIRHASNIGTKIKQGTEQFFNQKVTINDKTFVLNGAPASPVDYLGVPLNDLTDIPLEYSLLKHPRQLVTTTDTTKFDLITRLATGPSLAPASIHSFADKVHVGDQLYLRTSTDSDAGLDTGIQLSTLQENYLPMSQPRTMTVKYETHKFNPTTGKRDIAISKGQSISFTDKVSIGGKLYLRTTYDSNLGRNIVIPYSILYD